MGFNKGAQAIEQAEKAEQEARKAAYSSDRLEYLSIGEDETVHVRLITPAGEWIKVAQHSFVKTKDKPEDYKGNNWPKSMGAVCRNDKQIRSILSSEDCYICDKQLKSAFRDEFAKPSGRVWALAALRHQVRGDGTVEQLLRLGFSPEDAAKEAEELRGKLLGYDDVREEYDVLDKDKKPTGQKAERIKFVIVNMTWSSVFATFASAEENYVGGATGRDFAIRKTGVKPKYEYHVLSIDPIPGLAPGEEAWKRYTDGLERREIDLEDIVLKQASAEHYAQWFDPSKRVEKGKIVDSGATITETAAEVFTGNYPPRPVDEPVTEAQQAKIASMRDRLLGG